MENQRFEALSRICLNNWHYIKHRTLSFDDGINFFTGHSGSGKSTVIDAMQIVLYANTDTSCDVCRIAESLELFEYAPGVRDANNLGAWWLENKLDCSLPYEIDEFFDYAGYGESIAENNDGEFVEGLGFVCMEEGYTLEDVLQDTDQGMGGL